MSSSTSTVAIVRKNNNLIRIANMALRMDPNYRLTSPMIDRFITVLQSAEHAFRAEPSIDLVGAYAETLDLISEMLVKNEMTVLAGIIVEQGEKVKKECLAPLFSS